MVYFILQIFLFIGFIILGHSLWIYFKDNFTIKKTKNLNTTIEKYKNLIELNINSPSLALEERKEIVLEEEMVLENDLNQFLNELQNNNSKLNYI
jgi:DNA-binding transcriptional MerR regulator